MALLELFVFLALACGVIALIAHRKKDTGMTMGFVWFGACYIVGACAIATLRYV